MVNDKQNAVLISRQLLWPRLSPGSIFTGRDYIYDDGDGDGDGYGYLNGDGYGNGGGDGYGYLNGDGDGDGDDYS